MRCAACGGPFHTPTWGCVRPIVDDDGAVPLVEGDPEMPDDPIAQDEYFRDVDLENKGRRESLL